MYARRRNGKKNNTKSTEKIEVSYALIHEPALKIGCFKAYKTL